MYGVRVRESVFDAIQHWNECRMEKIDRVYYTKYCRNTLKLCQTHHYKNIFARNINENNEKNMHNIYNTHTNIKYVVYINS